MDEREKNLPKWAQELIEKLRSQHRLDTEHMAKELAVLRPRVDLLQRRIGGMEDLLKCAANGGHLTARQIVEVFEEYGLTLTPNS